MGCRESRRSEEFGWRVPAPLPIPRLFERIVPPPFMSEHRIRTSPTGAAVRRQLTPERCAPAYQRRSTPTRAPGTTARPSIALRVAYLFMLGCAAYAPIELVRLIVRHHDIYDQLTLMPTFALELIVVSWG